MTVNLRIGLPEVVTMGSLLFLAALVVLFIVEWPVGLVPAATYAVASIGTYAGYRQYARERAGAAVLPAEQVRDEKELIRFRVVDTVGVCPLGRRTGDVIEVGAAGSTAPLVCPEAAAVLQMAAADGQAVEQWCCPVYDHMLVLRKEAVAA